MTTEQLKELKELYATGEWICIARYFTAEPYEWVTADKASIHVFLNRKDEGYTDYKLIHKKHSEVLDHVLNGGEVQYKEPCYKHWNRAGISPDHYFFENYCDKCNYEIIKDKPICEHPAINNATGECVSCDFNVDKANRFKREDKPSLNGHYCLATKEHYDKLRDDGHKSKILGDDYIGFKCFYIVGNEIWGTLTTTLELFEPMHLHNNGWVFGSLEHGEEPKTLYKCSFCGHTSEIYNEPHICEIPKHFR